MLEEKIIKQTIVQMIADKKFDDINKTIEDFVDTKIEAGKSRQIFNKAGKVGRYAFLGGLLLDSVNDNPAYKIATVCGLSLVASKYVGKFLLNRIERHYNKVKNNELFALDEEFKNGYISQVNSMIIKNPSDYQNGKLYGIEDFVEDVLEYESENNKILDIYNDFYKPISEELKNERIEDGLKASNYIQPDGRIDNDKFVEDVIEYYNEHEKEMGNISIVDYLNQVTNRIASGEEDLTSISSLVSNEDNQAISEDLENSTIESDETFDSMDDNSSEM